MAIQLIPTLAPAPQQASQALGQSDEQLDQIRQYIAALRAAKQPVQHWTQGAANLTGDLLEGAARGKVNDALGQRQGAMTQEYVRALNTPGSQPDETSLSTGPSGGPVARPQAAGAGVTSTAAAPMAPGGDDQLTRIAAVVNQGETGRGANFDAQALGNISPDTHGSKSYGFMGLNSKSGSAAEFARRYGADLGLSAPPGSAEFDGQWRTASAQRPEAMRKAQMDHFRETQLQPVYADLQKLGIPTAVASDPRVLTYFADRHVQMGKLGQDNIVNAWQASGNDPVKFLHNMNEADGSAQALHQFFPNALAQGIYSARGHATRLATRLGGALGLGPSELAPIASAEGAPTGGPDPHVQSMVQALAGQQTAQAGGGAGPPMAAAQGQASPGAAPGAVSPMQHMANFLRMGYTPQQAAQRVQEMQGMMPQYKYDDPYGREYAETPGQPRRYTGRQFGPGKEVAQGGIAFSERLGPNNEVIREPIMPRFPGQQPAGAAPPIMPPAGSLGAAWSPKQGPPPFPRNMEELQAYPAKMEAFKSYQVEGGKESALLEQKRTPEQQAHELQQMREKEQTRIEAETSPEAIAGNARKTAAAKTAGGLADLNLEPVKESITHGGTAQSAINYINLMDQIGRSPDAIKMNTGPLAHEILKGKQFFKDTFGYDMGGIVSAEAVDKLNGFLASVAAKELTNRPTQFDFKTFLERNPGIEISPEGRQALLDGLRDVYRQDVELSKLAAKVEKPSDWPDIRDKYMSEHPIKMTYQGKEITSAEPLPGLQGIQATTPAAPPPQSIEHLRAHPETRSHFDARYGAGAAQKVLGK